MVHTGGPGPCAVRTLRRRSAVPGRPGGRTRRPAFILARMKTLRYAGAALVLIALVLLAACGNKGDLVMPDKQPPPDVAPEAE
jgi:predicted small lipoprotein YifL